MQQLADDLWMLDGTPRNGINVYVAGDVLIDAGTVLDRGRILKQVEDRPISAHALTHAHPDHYGSSHAVCKRLDVPLWCGADDVEAVEAGKIVWHGGRMIPGTPRPTRSRDRLREGDEVAGFHGAGHARPLPRPRLLLARIRPRADLRRRDVGAQPVHAARPDPRAVRDRELRTRSSTASRRGGSPRCSRRSSASATGRRCATRTA